MRLPGVDEAPSCWEPLNEEPLEAPLGRKGSKPKGSVPSPGMGGGGGGGLVSVGGGRAGLRDGA